MTLPQPSKIKKKEEKYLILNLSLIYFFNITQTITKKDKIKYR